ncbi:hypothetical protein J0904_05720 [Acinetobacter bereziniae]|uniref:hypothetical protein n=1 Tax=Acinetobacter TaxID=469 RepID=UPI0020760EB6|nr:MULTISPECIES: hypothetical protein [Acinetobacter]MCM8511585.1 hypothetical protein [Acinetobacter bereziniae]
MHKIFLTLFLIICTTAYGVEIDNELMKKNLDAANLQIEVLKAQIEVMKSYQDKFLTTVYWSLSGMVGVVILLIGYNWFTNFKNQEKEEKNLKELIFNNLEISKNEMLIYINNNLNELEIKNWNKLNGKVDEKYNLLSTKNNDLKRDLGYMKIKLDKLEYGKWKNSKVYGNCVSVAIEMIDLSLSLDNYTLETSLELLIEALELGLREEKKSTIDVDIITQIERSFSKLDKNYLPVKKRIEDLIMQLNNL